MMMQKNEQQHSLPGVLATLAAGFDLTTKHLWLILLPVLLDAFLWLGPRLSIRPLIEQFLTLWPQDPNLEAMVTQLHALAPYTNMFTFLSVPLVGVPALMSGVAPEKTPLAVSVTEISSLGVWFGYFVVFLLVGLAFTAVYYTLVANVVRQGDADDAQPLQPLPGLARQTGKVWVSFLLAGIALFVFLMILYLPLSLVSFLLTLLSPFLGLLALLGGMVLVMWVILAAFFVPQSIALNGRFPHRAFLESIQLIRQNGTTVMGIILVIILGGNLLDQFLLLSDNGSWITAVSILAHAFISTSFLTATFIFYRDRIQVTFSKA